MRPLRWIQSYIANDDPRAAAANLVAVIVVSNQPFYPLYLYAAVGSDAWVSVVSFLSTPFLFAVPAVSRWNATAGRALLVLVGTANTLLCAKAFGVASGVELFLFPCIMLATLLFRRDERWLMLALTGVPMAAYLLLHGRYGAPLIAFTAEQDSAMVTLHAVSVATLTAFIGINLATVGD